MKALMDSDARQPSQSVNGATTPRTSARDRLLTAALALFAADGPVAVNLEDVRQEAGVSVGALYHHFADKTALLDGLYLELTEQFQAGFIAELRSYPSAREGVEAGVRFYLSWVTGHRSAASVLLGHRPDGPALRDHNRRFFADVMAWWQTHVQYRALRPLPFDLIHPLWLGPAQEYTRHWIAGYANQPPDSVADVLAHAAYAALTEPS